MVEDVRNFFEDERKKELLEKYLQKTQEVKDKYNQQCTQIEKECFKAVADYIAKLSEYAADETDERIEKNLIDLANKRAGIRKSAISNVDNLIEGLRKLIGEMMLETIREELKKGN